MWQLRDPPQPSVVAEIVYDTAKRNVAFANLRLGPLDDNDYLWWTNVRREEFDPVHADLQPIFDSTIYYKLEMARQVAAASKDPEWIIQELKAPLVRASQRIADRPAFSTTDPNYEKLQVQCDQRDTRLLDVPTASLTVPTNAGDILSFPATCNAFVNCLDEFYTHLMSQDEDVDHNLVMEHKWRLQVMMNFYKDVIKRTQHPVDLRVVVDTVPDTWSYKYHHNSYHTDYPNIIARREVRNRMRIGRTSDDTDDSD